LSISGLVGDRLVMNVRHVSSCGDLKRVKANNEKMSLQVKGS
jgi:hypothetical protein